MTKGKLFSRRTDDLFRKVATPAYGPHREEQIRNKMKTLMKLPRNSDLRKDLILHYRNSEAFPQERATLRRLKYNLQPTGGRRRGKTQKRRR